MVNKNENNNKNGKLKKKQNFKDREKDPTERYYKKDQIERKRNKKHGKEMVQQ